MTNSVAEIRDSELLFVIGSNTTEAHPILGMEMKRALRNGAKLIVADPRRIPLAELADIHLQLRPGSDVALLNGLAHVIVTEDLVDWDYVNAHTEDFDKMREAVANCTPEWAESITGVPADDIRTAARWYATTLHAGIYYTLGITEHSHGTDNVYGLANLVLMTGHLGVHAAGLNPLRGQNNVQGANDAGASPVFLPGYDRVSDPVARAHWGQGWGTRIPEKPGLNLNQMMEELADGHLKGVYVMGEDIVVSEADAERIDRGLESCEFIVVQDIFMNETAKRADVILPAACFAEKDGVFTNTDRRVQRVRKAVDPPGSARADWEILCDLARAAGYPMPHYADAAEVYTEMASLAGKFSGISHARIDREGNVQWPCPTTEHPGTPTLHIGQPMRGTAPFHAIHFRPSIEVPDPAYPFVLVTGRTLYHYNASTQTRRSAGAHQRQPEVFVQVHPRDARRNGLTHGERAQVETRRGSISARVQVTDSIRRGCIWMPFHFAEARTNLLTTAAGDPVTGTSEFKSCAARVVAVAHQDTAAK